MPETRERPILQFDGVSLAYGERAVAHDVSFSVGEGRTLGIVGESGSGKTTLLQAAFGPQGRGLRLTGGRVLYAGQSVWEMGARSLRDLRGPGLACVFQDSASSFCPVRRIGAQMWESVRAHEKVSRRACDDRLQEVLGSLGFSDPAAVLRAYPHELSGGMAQRVGIACALMLRPRVLLADEPTSALDAASQAQVVAALRQARDEYGCAIVLVTHDFSLVESLCDEAVVLHEGRVVEQAPTAGLLARPQADCTRALVAAARPRIAVSPESIPQTPEPHAGAAALSMPQADAKTAGSVPSSATRVPAAAGTPLVDVSHLSFSNGRGKSAKPILRDFSLRIAPGEVVGLVGKSGCGKSTLARLIAGLAVPAEGSIALAPQAARPKRGPHKVQLVFQDARSSFDPRKTLGFSVAEGLRNAGATAAEAASRVSVLFERVGLAPELAARFPHEVSGGQCQRAAIARALAAEPALLIADEATSALDVTVQAQVVDLLRALNADLGMAVLFITHDLALAQALCTRLVAMPKLPCGPVTPAGPRATAWGTCRTPA